MRIHDQFQIRSLFKNHMKSYLWAIYLPRQMVMVVFYLLDWVCEPNLPTDFWFLFVFLPWVCIALGISGYLGNWKVLFGLGLEYVMFWGFMFSSSSELLILGLLFFPEVRGLLLYSIIAHNGNLIFSTSVMYLVFASSFLLPWGIHRILVATIPDKFHL